MLYIIKKDFFALHVSYLKIVRNLASLLFTVICMALWIGALLPMENKKDLEEIPERVRNTFSVHFMENIEDVLKIALLNK